MRFLSRSSKSGVSGELGSDSSSGLGVALGQAVAAAGLSGSSSSIPDGSGHWAGSTRNRRYWPLIVTLIAAALLAVALLIGLAIRESIRELTRQSLQSILSANTSAMTMWLSEACEDVDRIASDQAIVLAAEELLQRHNEKATWSVEDAHTAVALESLSRRIHSDEYLAWALIDESRVVVASSRDDLIGTILEIPGDSMQRQLRLTTTATRPFRSPIPLADEGPLSLDRPSIMCALAPLNSGARVIGSLALVMDPLEKFTELLSVARTGRTGETYAFDRQGMLISRSRFEPHLRAAGLLDEDPNVTSPLNVSIRDPGANLVTGGKATVARNAQPLTLMADQATRGATGSNVRGYNDYRGVPVVGAWRWLPEYGFGIATEIDVAEAYRPVRLLRTSLLWMLALITAAVAGLLAFASLMRGMNERLRRANRAVRRLGQYELGELVGQGGMGSVYRGHHHLLRREVAIKVLEAGEVSPQSVSRFEREVQMTSSLRHPNTIDIYDYGRTDDGTFFYVMEYVEGITLQELVDEFGAQPASRVIHLLHQICGSLAEAHQLGLVHRDIKPSNILLTARAGLFDMIKVLDFGLVKEIDRDTVELTRTDGITGTPMYMSPEAVRDASTSDQRSDLYSVGAVGYTLLTGQPLFDDDSAVDVCLRQLNEDPIRPDDRVGIPLPNDLQNLLMSCLRKDPEDRPLSMDDLDAALCHCEDAGRWNAAEALRWWEVEYGQSADRSSVAELSDLGTHAGEGETSSTAR